MTAAGNAVEQALALLRAPLQAGQLRGREVPGDVLSLIRWAAGEEASLHAAAEQTGEAPADLREAAVLFLQQVLFAPDADSYRLLGVPEHAQHDVIKEHYGWLMRWLHPDRNLDDWDTVFADRVTRAWQNLRTPARRQDYDRARAARTATASSPTTPSPTTSAPTASAPPPVAALLVPAVAPRHRTASRGRVETALSPTTVRRLPVLVLGTLAVLAFGLLGAVYVLDRVELDRPLRAHAPVGMVAGAPTITPATTPATRPVATTPTVEIVRPTVSAIQPPASALAVVAPPEATQPVVVPVPAVPAAALVRDRRERVGVDTTVAATVASALPAVPPRAASPASDVRASPSRRPEPAPIAATAPVAGPPRAVQQAADADVVPVPVAAPTPIAPPPRSPATIASTESSVVPVAMPVVMPAPAPAAIDDAVAAPAPPPIAVVADAVVDAAGPVPIEPVLIEPMLSPVEVTQAFTAAYANGDLPALLGLFSADARNNRGGLQAIREDYASMFASTSRRALDLTRLRWRRDASLAHGEGPFVASLRRHDEANDRQVHGRLNLQLRIVGGQWRIAVVRHENADEG